MSDRLTYKKIYVDSAYRLPESNSTSDFIIELDQNFEIPPRTKMFVTECSFSTPFYTTEKGFYERFYIMLYNRSNVSLRNTAVDVSGEIYYANQLSFKIQSELNTAFNDIVPDLFLIVYGQSERKMELKLNYPLSYKIKIPIHEELETYVNGEWKKGQFEYDNLKPKSINYLLSNYIAYDPASFWLSGYFNLVPFQNICINCLSDYKYSAPNNFSSSVIKKNQINQQLGGVITDFTAPIYADFIDVGGKNIKRLHFRITISRNKLIGFHGVPISFSILFLYKIYNILYMSEVEPEITNIIQPDARNKTCRTS